MKKISVVLASLVLPAVICHADLSEDGIDNPLVKSGKREVNHYKFTIKSFGEGRRFNAGTSFWMKQEGGIKAEMINIEKFSKPNRKLIAVALRLSSFHSSFRGYIPTDTWDYLTSLELKFRQSFSIQLENAHVTNPIMSTQKILESDEIKKLLLLKQASVKAPFSDELCYTELLLDALTPEPATLFYSNPNLLAKMTKSGSADSNTFNCSITAIEDYQLACKDLVTKVLKFGGEAEYSGVLTVTYYYR